MLNTRNILPAVASVAIAASTLFAVGLGAAAPAHALDTVDLFHVKRTTVGKPVSLSDAAVKPTWKRTLKPNQVVAAFTCRHGKPSDYGAYTANGGKLGAQVRSEWGQGNWNYSWDVKGPGSVVTNGKHWENTSSRSILVAEWCESR